MKKIILITLTGLSMIVCYKDIFSQVSTSAKSSGYFFDIENLSSVTELDLSAKDINSLPKEIFEMNNLQSLDLSNNYLNALPLEIKELQSLKILKLNGNNIYDLPDEISRLKFLQEVYLDYMIWCHRLDEVKKLTDVKIILVN